MNENTNQATNQPAPKTFIPLNAINMRRIARIFDAGQGRVARRVPKACKPNPDAERCQKDRRPAHVCGVKEYNIIDGNTLMAQKYEPLQFVVEKILPHGLFILAGSGKMGMTRNGSWRIWMNSWNM